MSKIILSIGQVFRGVHIEERGKPGVEGEDFLGENLPFFDLWEEVNDLEIILSQQVFHEMKAFLRINGMQGLQPILCLRDDDVITGRKGNQVGDQSLVEERHVAGCHKSMGMGSMEEARIDSSQGPLPGAKVCNKAQIKIQVVTGRIGHHEDFIEELGEDFFCAVDDSLAVDYEEGLVLTHAEVFTPGEDDSGNLHRKIARSQG